MNIVKRMINRLNRDAVKNKDNVEYHFDILECNKEKVLLRGWIFSRKGRIELLKLVFSTHLKEKTIPLRMTKRVDVANAFALKDIRCGFRMDAECFCDKNVDVYLEYQMGSVKRRIYVGTVTGQSNQHQFNVTECRTLSYRECREEFQKENKTNFSDVYDKETDIIVPVYNGFEYLENLFAGIEKTKVKYRLYIINDCSTDERVLPFLRQYADGKENVRLLVNENNLGFVQSVNKALALTRNDVAIVNTDVILPDQWLERLMAPIAEKDMVASATPFTNSGTICSFPVFCENNPIFLGMDLEEIDRFFSGIKSRYVEMPTGVGFCMGMSRKAIDQVGFLDAETFYKGYGEENDWCQRAIQKGFVNVQVENLFVWHKHGGSFQSEDKKRYIERNLKLLGERYPSYHSDVAKFCAKDPNFQLREWAKLQLIFEKAPEFTLIFNHNWGGGANTYLKDRMTEILSSGKGVIQIIDDAELGVYGKVFYSDQKAKFYVKDFEELFEALCPLKCSRIIINELVSFENIRGTHGFILRLKEHFGAELIMLCHDFFALCPSIYLMNDKQKHCFIPVKEECRECFQKNRNKMNTECSSIDQWREMWGEFLENCDEAIAFSENTKEYYQHYYPNVNYRIIPHRVDYIVPVKPYKKSTDQLTIGVIGNLMPSKGADIIYQMSDLIKERNLNARIVVIGPDMDGNKNEDIIIHGKYKREELPVLMEKYQVDVVFIASVWPETFSYTTEEAMLMGMKVAAFDLGAPGERLKHYQKGIIIKEMTAEAALDTILRNVN